MTNIDQVTLDKLLEGINPSDPQSDLISTITSEVMDAVLEWQNRPLEPMYLLVFFDALRVKIRDEGTVRNKAIYLALGV